MKFVHFFMSVLDPDKHKKTWFHMKIKETTILSVATKRNCYSTKNLIYLSKEFNISKKEELHTRPLLLCSLTFTICL